ncbi:hypothetical protein T492DRAFT_951122 [Pavlovales sp. CCMP2436]|nr:hypothetical protein T492DRAFT_951122 [Pavlovales sp. CCMP2436]
MMRTPTAAALARDDGVVAQLELMLGAAVASGHQQARFHRAVGSLAGILLSARERRTARAFHYWAARQSEGAVNAELIFERGVLVESFSRARFRSEHVRDATTLQARLLALRVCACSGRLAARRALELWMCWASSLDSSAQAALKQASRFGELARAIVVLLSHRDVLSLASAIVGWREAGNSLREAARNSADERNEELEELQWLTARENALAEMRLRSLCVFSVATSLRLTQLGRRLGTWRRNVIALVIAANYAMAARDLVARERAQAERHKRVAFAATRVRAAADGEPACAPDAD